MRTPFPPLLALVLVLMAATGWPRPAAATPSYDNCTGFLDPDPQAPSPQLHSVNQPGTWCLRKDLVIQFSDVTYALIDVHGDDVTIDCKGHKLQVLGGGQIDGVGASFSDRLTVRNCRFEGFKAAVAVNYGTWSNGHVVEDNVMVGNDLGVYMSYSTHVVVSRNRIHGGRSAVLAYGAATITDNLIDGAGAGVYSPVIGIDDATGGEVRGNVIRNFHRHSDEFDTVAAIEVDNSSSQPVGAHVAIYDNVISGTGEGWLLATRCDRPTSRVADNVIRGVGAVTEGCTVGTNDVSP